MKPSSQGFHLVELLTTVSILTILIAFCLPLYSQYYLQARRLEAATHLSRLSLAMEKFHIEHDTWQDATLAALHFPETIAKNNYRLIIQSATRSEYTLLAEPLGKQAEKDKHCGGLLLNSNARRWVTGPGKVEECW